QPGQYNQAIMDFGATVCLPRNPLCTGCPFQKNCVAYQSSKVNELPVRKKEVKIQSRHFNYLILGNGRGIYIQKRTAQDIWKGLYELPLLETNKPPRKDIDQLICQFLNVKKVVITGQSEEMIQRLSHRKIHFRFFEIALGKRDRVAGNGWEHAGWKELRNFAFPKTIQSYLEEKFLI